MAINHVFLKKTYDFYCEFRVSWKRVIQNDAYKDSECI